MIKFPSPAIEQERKKVENGVVLRLSPVIALVFRLHLLPAFTARVAIAAAVIASQSIYTQTVTAESIGRPNIVLIMSDDQD